MDHKMSHRNNDNITLEQIHLGTDVVYTPDKEPGLNGNILVTGGTGAGKTVSIMEPLLMHGLINSNGIISMTKRRLVKEYQDMFRKRGYTVKHLNMAQPEKSTICFDPLQYIRCEDDIHNLSNSIVNCDPERHQTSHQDPYWDDSAMVLLDALVAIALMTVTDHNATMADVLKLYEKACPREGSVSIQTDLDSLLEEIERKAPDCYAVRKWHVYRCLPYRTGSCVYSSLAVPLEQMFSEECREMIERLPSIDFREFADQKSILFVSASPVSISSYRYINLFWSTAFKELLEYANERDDMHLPRKVRVCCDDFATGSPIPRFAEYISIFRECGISCVLLLQSETQLHQMYGEQASHTIINNCDLYVSMSSMDFDTAVSVSRRMDLPVKEILELPIEKLCVFRKGYKSLITQRYRTYDDPYYKQVHQLPKDR